MRERRRDKGKGKNKQVRVRKQKKLIREEGRKGTVGIKGDKAERKRRVGIR